MLLQVKQYHLEKRYQISSQTTAKCFMYKGYNIVSGGTDNHCMLIDLRSKNLTGKLAENTLVASDITVNKNMVPFDDKSPMITSGIRIGTPAITTRGITEKEIPLVVELIDEALMNNSDAQKIKNVKEKVNSLMKNYKLFGW